MDHMPKFSGNRRNGGTSRMPSAFIMQMRHQVVLANRQSRARLLQEEARWLIDKGRALNRQGNVHASLSHLRAAVSVLHDVIRLEESGAGS